ATLLVFPEGTRQEGNQISELFDGTAYLAAKSGVPVVPIGIAGTEKAMGAGSRIPKPYKVRICVGSPIPAPDKNSKRGSLSSWTQRLTLELQAAQDAAQTLIDN
ncbi:MAG TPA: lysophospholipid acyltransferase family protein, partial [Acidimicrobiales bacterium]|nr:lysophospholipid acyltransferase family protein [Acidimicrobiales bacterium]